MSGFVRAPCGSCGQLVIWAVTTNAKRMPVDAEPSPDGNIALEHRAGGLPPLARVLNTTQQFGRTNLRVSHFSTCPDASSWRKRGRT